MNNFNKILRGTFILLILVSVVLTAASCDVLTDLGIDLGIDLGLGHKHNLTKVDKVEATCTEDGHERYYVCDDCNKFFKDAGATFEIDAPTVIKAEGHNIVGVLGTEPSCSEAGTETHYTCTECHLLFSDKLGENEIDAPVVINPSSHDLVKTEAKAVSCTENGNIEFYTCKDCKNIYSDAEGTVQITAEETVIVSDGHDLTETPAKAASCTENGNIAYWTCGDCDKVYSDAQGTTEITLADTVIGSAGHSYNTTLVVEGATTSYEPGASFTTNGLVVKIACSCGHSEPVTDYTYDKTGALSVDDTEVTITYVDGDKTYTAKVAITVVHTHTMSALIPQVDPTCTETGTLAHYDCTLCHKHFADAEGTNELLDLTISVTGHTLTKTEAVASSCTVQGHNAYWTCSVCHGVFADELGENATTVEAETLPLANHDTELKYDENGHYYDCKNCDYVGETEAHVGFAYPGEVPMCNVCSAQIGSVAGWDGWVEFRPGIKEVVGGAVTSASHVTVNGVMASKYAFGAGEAGSTTTIWTHSDRNDWKNGHYQVRIPSVNGQPTYVYLYVSNDGNTEVSFRIFTENYGDKGGVDVTLGAGESGWFKYQLVNGNSVGNNMNIKLLADLASDTEVTIYGYFYLPEAQITNLHILNQSEIKLSYEEGEAFNLPKLILGTYISNSKGDILSDGGEELYYIPSNYTVSGLENGQILTAGTYTVTVSFGGKSVELQVVVSSHTHNIVYVPYVAASCDMDGNTAHYMCNVGDCGQLFADADGNTPINAEDVVIAKGHVASAAIPGYKACCSRCGEEYGDVLNADGWVHFAPGVVWNDYYEGISGTVNGSSYINYQLITLENGMNATKFSFAAGTPANASTAFWNDQDLTHNIKVPVRHNANGTRTIVVITNHGTEDLTFTFGQVDNGRDMGSGTVTVPAGKTAAVEFTITGGADLGNNGWIAVRNDVNTDTDITLYGFFYIGEDVEGLKIINPANKLTFAAGEVFSAEGLRLKLTNSHGSGAYFGQTEIYSNFTTDLDGYMFTASDTGIKTVTVSFGGKSVTYEVEVAAHKHQLELVSGKDAVKCVEDGYEAYYRCTVAGCGELFADETGNTKISAPAVIPCHTATATLPGETIICADCGEGYAVYENNTLVHFTPGKPNNPGEAPYYEGISGTVNGTSHISKDYITLENGYSAIRFTVAAGTPENASIALWCNNDNRIPVKLATGGTKVLMSVTNHGNQDVIISIGAVDSGNDKGSGTALIPAGQTVAVAFVVASGSDYGNNIWFAVRNEVTEETQISIHGYFDLESDADVGIKIKDQAHKTTFAVGETFTAEGLTLRLNNDKPVDGNAYYGFMKIYNYTTNFDGVVFEEAGTYTVEVYFAGHKIEYTITVA